LNKLVKPKEQAGFVHVQGLGPACSNFGNAVVTNLIQVIDNHRTAVKVLAMSADMFCSAKAMDDLQVVLAWALGIWR
jgi:hypothetical protein